MKRGLIASAMIGLAAAAGCASAGLSPREEPGRSQSLYLYSLYEQLPPEAVNAPPRPMRMPASVAVVQVGEAAAPAALLDALRADPGVFRRVETLPGIVHESGFDHSGQRRRAPDVSESARIHVTGLRNLAADLGMDYLLLVGGTIDYDTNGTKLSLMDLTVVGAFVVPSQTTRATARANGALIDVATGRVVVNSAAESNRKSLVPLASVDAEQVKLLTALRDDVVGKLGAQVIADARTRAMTLGVAPAGAGFGFPAAPAAGGPFPATEGSQVPPAQRYETGRGW